MFLDSKEVSGRTTNSLYRIFLDLLVLLMDRTWRSGNCSRKMESAPVHGDAQARQVLSWHGAFPRELRPMYELADFGDPWEYWSVHASQDRSKAEAKRHRDSHVSSLRIALSY